ncbi:LysM peptidoglycan-binding domain-containing protein [Bacillus alkalicellulosilyticus]|uniref:LysM peptidoglycan-binding domain-containing protein n=1 Tax=Alkalihalobacterium alkalicellulosilyticum TaxID=1912214 RepID=UPI000996B511|nr:LysM peptidoglycan-binding domain-containing protein [Bacillus alkalicellulosilyticus]
MYSYAPQFAHGMQNYIVQEGDTLLSIAQFYNVSLPMLYMANSHLQDAQLQKGDQLKIPLQINQPVCGPNMLRYCIRENDTLESIADKFDTSVQMLQQSNPILVNQFWVGELLCIPIHWEQYHDDMNRFTFMYPGLLEPLENDEQEWIQFEGEIGFFQISIVETQTDSDTLLTMYQHYTANEKQWFGTSPLVESVVVQNKSGLIILPSTDQREEYRGVACLLLPYAPPNHIESEGTYWFVCFANKEIIYSITGSLQYF